MDKYNLAEQQGKNLIIPIDVQGKISDIDFKKIIIMLEGIHFSQDNQSLKEIGVLWDKTYTFVCRENDLVTHLEKMNFREGQSVFMSLGMHVFYIEKSNEGFYLFDPNRIDNNSLYPLIKDEQQLAEKIVKNCKLFMKSNSDCLVFSMKFVSYASQSNSFLENAIINLGKEELKYYPTIRILCDAYGQKKISRLDCALAITDPMLKKRLFALPTKMCEFFNTIDSHIQDERLFIDTLLSYDTNSINQKVYYTNESLLLLAVDSNQIILVKSLLRHPDLQVNTRDINENAPLLLASENGYSEIVEMLLKHPDIQVNLTDNQGVTPLLVASQRGYIEIVKMLLEHPDIQVNLTDNQGVTPLYVASGNGYIFTVNLLVKKGALMTIGISADVDILRDYAKRKERHLTFNSVLKTKNNNKIPRSLSNFTPLHAAIFYGHEEVVKTLLINGADVHATTGNLSCLELAKIMDHDYHVLKLANNSPSIEFT